MKSEKKTRKLLGDKSYVENLGAQEGELIMAIAGLMHKDFKLNTSI